MEHLRNDRDPKWTDSCLLKTSCWRIRQQSLSPPCRGSIWTESKPKFLSFSTMGEITPTTSLYLLWKYQWVGEPDAVFKIHNIRISQSVQPRRNEWIKIVVTTLQPLWWATFRKTCTFNSTLGEIQELCALNACWWRDFLQGVTSLHWHDTGFLHLLRHLIKWITVFSFPTATTICLYL